MQVPATRVGTYRAKTIFSKKKKKNHKTNIEKKNQENFHGSGAYQFT